MGEVALRGVSWHAQPGGLDAAFWMLRSQEPDLPLFWNAFGRAICTLRDPGHYIYHRLKRHANAIGMELTPHRLRHSFGTELRNAGVPLEELADVMGHEDIRTTKGYAELSKRGLRAIRAAHTRMSDAA